MFNDHESPDSTRTLLNAAVATALDRLDHLFLSSEVLTRLTRHVLANNREAGGVDAAAACIARASVDERTANIRAAIGRFSQTVAPGRKPEAVAALGTFSQEAVEALTLGKLAEADRCLVTFSYTINQLSAPRAVPRVPLHADDLPDNQRRGLAACGWNSLETQFLTIELMRSREPLRAFDATSAATAGGRQITRQWLREINAPTVPEFRTKFMAALPQIPEQ